MRWDNSFRLSMWWSASRALPGDGNHVAVVARGIEHHVLAHAGAQIHFAFSVLKIVTTLHTAIQNRGIQQSTLSADMIKVGVAAGIAARIAKRQITIAGDGGVEQLQSNPLVFADVK